MILKNPDIRHLYDMKSVLYDKKWLKTAPNLELYYMYRGVKNKNGLRYDITVIPPLMLGKEFAKTKGHEHLKNNPELYEVLEGEAIFLAQKRKGDSVSDIYAVKAKKGEAVVIPPGYGHATINPSKKTLKMANWVDKNCQSDYSPIGKRKGFCRFYLKAGWVKNKNYKNIPELRFEKPLKSTPKNLDFLKEKES